MPNALDQRVEDFLAQRRLAVAGVSRQSGEAANVVYRKLRSAGYEVVPINPKAEQVEGDRCYPDLRSASDRIDGVVIATAPEVTDQVVRECVELGIQRVWIHRSFGRGSLSEEAVTRCREHGISVIAGACPMMYCQPVDFGHRCIRWILKMTGGLPR